MIKDDRLHKKESSRRVHRMARAMTLCSLIVSLQAGCSHQTHAKHKQQAQERWSSVRADVQVQLARQQYRAGKIDEALATIQQALAYDPKCAEAYMIQARCQLESGLIRAASRSAESAARTLRNNAELAALRGLIAERSGDPPSALGYYRDARRLGDQNVDYLLAEAECLVAMGRPDEASTLLEDERRAYGEHSSIHALMGEIALARGDEVAALNAFRSAMAGGVDDPVIIEQYVVLSSRGGECTEALAAAETLDNSKVEVAASDSLLRAVAQCHLKLNHLESARQSVRTLIKRDPDDLDAWRLMARIAVQGDDASIMHQSAANIDRLSPGDADATMIRAYSLISQGRLDRASTLLRQFIHKNGGDMMAHCLLASVLERLDQPREAINHYQEALALEPGSPWPREALARLVKTQGAS